MAAEPTPLLVCGSISKHPVSLGAVMHRAAAEALDLGYVYAPFAVREPDLYEAVQAMRVLGIRGLGVSMPFKQRVMALCDEVAPLAARIGAVNTLVHEAGRIVGHNTDAHGAVEAVREVRAVEGARCLVLGAGGAGRAVVFGLVDAGAEVTVANRDAQKAEALAEDAGALAGVALERAGALAPQSDVVINATSLGMQAEGEDAGSPLPDEALSAGLTVVDIVYKPLETRLLCAARARGATAQHGGRMLLHQAARQFELYTGRAAPLSAMDAALRGAIGEG